MSDECTAHDLFRINLKSFTADLLAHARAHAGNVGATPAPWEWYVKGEFQAFLYTINQDAAKETFDTYTRDNYVKFSRMMYFIQTKLPHLLSSLPEWSYLVTELHCRVLERELLASGHPDTDVNERLRLLLCRMQQ
jgi:hypothetical protein